jgi:hypothetical protein
MMRLIQEGNNMKIRLCHHKIADVKKCGYPLEWQVRLDATVYLRTSGNAIKTRIVVLYVGNVRTG